MTTQVGAPGGMTVREWWEVVRDAFRARLVANRWMMWAALLAQFTVLCGVLLVLRIGASSEFLQYLAVVPLSGAAMLSVVLVLARTRTVSAVFTFRLFSLSIAWSFVVAMACAWAADSLAPAMSEGSVPDLSGGVNSLWARTAIAGFGEESLKLAPLFILATLAPGRVRRFSAVDWAVVGFACGVGFLVAEETARAVDYWVTPELWVSLDSGSVPFGPTLWPLASSDPTGTEDGAVWAGHQVATALVAAGIGITCALWRRAEGARDRAIASAGVLIPIALWWIVAVDHASANAASETGLIAESIPRFMSLTHDLALRGQGRGVLLVVLVGACMMLDAERVWPVVRERTDVARVWSPMRSLVEAVDERSALASAHLPAIARPFRWMTVVLGRLTAIAVLEVNRIAVRTRDYADELDHPWWGIPAVAFLEVVQVRVGRELSHRTRNDLRRSARDVVRLQQLGRLTAVVALLTLALAGTVVAAWASLQVQSHVDNLHWLPGLLDDLGSWWAGLGWKGQAIAILFILAVLMFTPLGLGASLFWTGVAAYGLSHARGLSDLVSDPSAAVRNYVDTSTPQSVGLDVLDFGLTFAPGGVVSAGARTGVNQAVRRSMRDHGDEAWDLLAPAPFSRLASGVDPTSLVKWDKVPGWLARVRLGTQWHRSQQRILDEAGGVSELHVKKRLASQGDGPLRYSEAGSYRVDHYAYSTARRRIYSMKHTQLAAIKPETGIGYLREFSAKYDVGTPIAKKPSTPAELVGDELRGQKILLVPVQERAVPDGVVSVADELDITIMDAAGRVY